MQEGDVMTLVAKSGKWTRTERKLYGGARVRVLGETDHDGRMLVEVMTGDLTSYRLWASADELIANGSQTRSEARGGEKGPADDSAPACERSRDLEAL